MEILHNMKGKLMDTWEKFHIYQETKLGSQVNYKNSQPKYFIWHNSKDIR